MQGIVGIDEVGRGCWAGPLVAGAVILSSPIVGLKDSKVLTKAQREKLTATIEVQALAFGLGWVTADEIDMVGLTKAVALAMQRALKKIQIVYDSVIIDGSYNFLPSNKLVTTLVKADASVPAVSAASIIAKVARDNYMTQQHLEYPEYGFDTHVGYGTKRHAELLKQYGPCALHRKSYKPVQLVLR
jgi:ribonuclease HII